MTEHLCVGPTCWTCGEPTELRDMRWAIWKALLNKNENGLVATECSELARIAVKAVRDDLIEMMTINNKLRDQLYFAKKELAELKEHHRIADVEE